jgi:hypothetical protein
MATVSNRDGHLGRALVTDMERLTQQRFEEDWLANIARNNDILKRHGRSISELRSRGFGLGDSAIVIAAGPSIRRKNPAPQIMAAGFRGAIIVTESAMPYCLRNGLVPDLMVTLDPHATRIVRWLGDPHLSEQNISQDDYFRRQDMDPALADEIRANRELIDLMNRYGKNLRVALSTTASKAVVDRVIEIGMEIYWWNPMLDDPDKPDSVTVRVFEQNGLPCINAGGNVGSACWMIADAVLGKTHIALTGMDFSYYQDTPFEQTQYYHEAVALVGDDNLENIYFWVHNPHINTRFYTDPAYMWYRECFLDMVKDGLARTYNCTEGGILFGEGITFCPLSEFLADTATLPDSERIGDSTKSRIIGRAV